jgi:hypothetical protein
MAIEMKNPGEKNPKARSKKEVDLLKLQIRAISAERVAADLRKLAHREWSEGDRARGEHRLERRASSQSRDFLAQGYERIAATFRLLIRDLKSARKEAARSEKKAGRK